MVSVVPYRAEHREALIELSLRAWEDVFPLMRQSVPGFVYECFYPAGWERRRPRRRTPCRMGLHAHAPRRQHGRGLHSRRRSPVAEAGNSPSAHRTGGVAHPGAGNADAHGGNGRRPRPCTGSSDIRSGGIRRVAGGQILQRPVGALRRRSGTPTFGSGRCALDLIHDFSTNSHRGRSRPAHAVLTH